MIGEFLLRLAVALPILLLLLVGTLLAARRGWIPLPGMPQSAGWRRPRTSPNGGAGAEPLLEIIAMRGLTPALRLAVVAYRGEELLVGIAPQGLQLLARQPAAGTGPDGTALQSTGAGQP
jgi:hypothetical protein